MASGQAMEEREVERMLTVSGLTDTEAFSNLAGLKGNWRKQEKKTIIFHNLFLFHTMW